MTNTAKRLILFFLAVPGLMALILFLPHYGHLGVFLVLLVSCVLGTMETRSLLAAWGVKLPSYACGGGALLAAAAWFSNMGFLPPSVQKAGMILLIIWALGEPVTRKTIQDKERLNRTGAWLLIIFYPGWFLTWIVHLAFLPESSLVLLLFMFTVYLNDSAAWLFGRLWGRHQGFCSVSPNKSLEGFGGGLLASLLVLGAGGFFFPQAIPLGWGGRLLFGFLAGIASIAGDLVESSLKRAAGKKDSGNLILGRGGMLDSIDSLLLTAPVFWIFLKGF